MVENLEASFLPMEMQIHDTSEQSYGLYKIFIHLTNIS